MIIYYLNKTVGGLLNPVSIGLLLLLVGIVLVWRNWRRTGLAFCLASMAWTLAWSCPFMFSNIMADLEMEYPPQKAEDMPCADAIVLLGGGMSCNTNELIYPEMFQAADRVWHAARLWKAGKAPVVITSGELEAVSTVPLLRDMGLPDSAIIVEPDAKNTEENAQLVAAILKKRVTDPAATSKILLVTSGWHMRRSILMFERAFASIARDGGPKIEIIPAATDYDGLCCKRPFKYMDIFPSAESMSKKSYAFKEILGYWGYRLFRR